MTPEVLAYYSGATGVGVVFREPSFLPPSLIPYGAGDIKY